MWGNSCKHQLYQVVLARLQQLVQGIVYVTSTCCPRRCCKVTHTTLTLVTSPATHSSYRRQGGRAVLTVNEHLVGELQSLPFIVEKAAVA